MKKFLITIIIAAAVFGGLYLYQNRVVRPSGAPSPRPEQQAQCAGTEVKSDYVKYCGQEGKNAFELLTAATAVEFKSYDFGVFVESINGVKPDTQHFWKLYVNGAESQVGADQAQTKNGDLIEWKLEEVKQ